jgi:hypothetical protein
MMIPYKNLDGHSSVVEYEIGVNSIKVRFRSDIKIYVYDYVSPGQTHVERMKKLAIGGKGLASYMSRNIKENYSRIEH